MPRFTNYLARGWLLLLVFWTLPALAGASWKTPREALDQRVTSVDFSIYYTLEGEHAFAPDVPAGKQRETVAAARLSALIEQLNQANRFFREILGLRPPFSSERYAAGHGIDIHIIKLDGKSGSTGDELQRLDYRHFPQRSGVLTIALSNKWRPTSLTPAHELFHAYQYSYTFFKNAWFLEGLARASESFFLPPLAKPATTALPQSLDELDGLLARSYTASHFWRHLVERCGHSWLATMLAANDRLDDEAARSRGVPTPDWPEYEQRTPENNLYLLRGLLETLVAPHCSAADAAEIRAFTSLLNTWLERGTKK